MISRAPRVPHFGAARAVLLPILAAVALAAGGCNGSGSTPSTAPAKAQVRFAEGAPKLEAVINGVLQELSGTYLTVNNATVASSFTYGTFTPFVPVPAGTLTLNALEPVGYALGPVKTNAPVAAGNSYTVILAGNYPKYTALVFEEPPASTNASLSLYEASPARPSADFGRYKVSTNSNFAKLGRAHYGSVVTVSLGKSVVDFGGYVGNGNHPLFNGAIALSAVDSLDATNALPFNNAGRLSLFLFDPNSGGLPSGPVFGSLDQ